MTDGMKNEGHMPGGDEFGSGLSGGQHIIDHDHAPRVHITYDVEIGGVSQRRELPFVVGIMADLSGSNEQIIPVDDRVFAEITSNNYDEVIDAISPRATFSVPNRIKSDGSEIDVDITFKCMEDFSPVHIVKHVNELNGLYDKLCILRDFSSKIEGKVLLQSLLSEVIKRPELRESLKDQIAKADSQSTSTSNDIKKE